MQIILNRYRRKQQEEFEMYRNAAHRPNETEFDDHKKMRDEMSCVESVSVFSDDVPDSVSKITCLCSQSV